MYRSAMCLKMLNILKSRQRIVSKDELALELETNVRNISEYKKELEAAGYAIEYVCGRYGGYYLNEDCLIPTLKFTTNEKHALISSLEYLKNHNDFLMIDDLLRAHDKIACSSKKMESLGYVYTQNMQVKTSVNILKIVALIQEAIKGRNQISFDYSSLVDREFKQRLVFPYDIVNSDGQYYLIGYALSDKRFRNYKISDLRLRNLKIMPQHFGRDSDYRLSSYIGKKGIYKDKEQRVKLRILGTLAIYIAEHEIGIDTTYTWDNQDLVFETTFENEMSCDSFILSLGENAIIEEPPFIKKRIVDKLNKMQSYYIKE